METVGVIVGVDPSERLVRKAEELSSGTRKITYEVGDGKSLRFGEGEFDAVVLHTILTHVLGPDQILSEASRVLKDGGLRMATAGRSSRHNRSGARHNWPFLPYNASVLLQNSVTTLFALVHRLPPHVEQP